MFYEFPDVFLNNQLYSHFSYCFGLNLKKNHVQKVNIYNQELNINRIIDGVERYVFRWSQLVNDTCLKNNNHKIGPCK